jgi:hypothetical protein
MFVGLVDGATEAHKFLANYEEVLVSFHERVLVHAPQQLKKHSYFLNGPQDLGHPLTVVYRGVFYELQLQNVLLELSDAVDHRFAVKQICLLNESHKAD